MRSNDSQDCALLKVAPPHTNGPAPAPVKRPVHNLTPTVMGKNVNRFRMFLAVIAHLALSVYVTFKQKVVLSDVNMPALDTRTCPIKQMHCA